MLLKTELFAVFAMTPNTSREVWNNAIPMHLLQVLQKKESCSYITFLLSTAVYCTLIDVTSLI